MNQQEIEKVMEIPFPSLAELCRDPKELAKVLTVAINVGIAIGHHKADISYNEMFQGYNKENITN